MKNEISITLSTGSPEQLTHAAVLEQYAQVPNADPALLEHMGYWANQEAQAAQTELDSLGTMYEASEADSDRYEISPQHHHDHLEATEFIVPDIREHSVVQQNALGEIMEIGDEAIQGSTLSEDVAYAVEQLANLSMLANNSSTDGFKLANEHTNTLLTELEWAILPDSDVQGLLTAGIAFDTTYYSANPTAWTEPTTVTLQMLKRLSVDQCTKAMADTEGGESPLVRYLQSLELNTQRAWDIGEELRYQAYPVNLKDIPHGQNVVLDRVSDVLTPAQFRLLTLPEVPTDRTDKDAMDDYESQAYVEMLLLFSKDLGLSSKLVMNIDRAMSNRMHMDVNPESEKYEMTPYYNRRTMRVDLNNALNVITMFPIADIERLHDELGMVNFDMYKAEDVENMLKLLDGDENLIHHLQAGDTKVIFSDAYGDYNGAMMEVLPSYANRGGRTLLFEIGQPSDIYRRMIMLKKLGVKPSTLVVAAHGQPGITVFGGQDRSFKLVTTNFVGEVNHVQNGLALDKARLDCLASDEFMQDSRGIDDALEHMGRRTFILNSCSSDAMFNEILPSTAETIMQRANSDTLDIYGANSAAVVEGKDGTISFNGDKDGDWGSVGTKLTRQATGDRWSRVKQWRQNRQLKSRYGYQAGSAAFSPKRTAFMELHIDNREEIHYI